MSGCVAEEQMIEEELKDERHTGNNPWNIFHVGFLEIEYGIWKYPF